jgi:hypothetical protein
MPCGANSGFERKRFRQVGFHVDDRPAISTGSARALSSQPTEDVLSWAHSPFA